MSVFLSTTARSNLYAGVNWGEQFFLLYLGFCRCEVMIEFDVRRGT